MGYKVNAKVQRDHALALCVCGHARVRHLYHTSLSATEAVYDRCGIKGCQCKDFKED